MFPLIWWLVQEVINRRAASLSSRPSLARATASPMVPNSTTSARPLHIPFIANPPKAAGPLIQMRNNLNLDLSPQVSNAIAGYPVAPSL
jgi:hypothetical protein